MPTRIVVIEDEPLIALDIEAAVSEAGCEVAGTAGTISQAHSLLERVAHDAVILDANLGGESAKPIVEMLDHKRVPYIVVSGYSRAQLDFLDTDAVLIGKPFSYQELVLSIQECLTTNGE